MTTKRSSAFTIILISGFLLATATIFACAWEDEPDNIDTSVFAPEVIHQPGKQPFFLSHHTFYLRPDYEIPITTPTLTERNTAEWKTYFKNALDTSDLNWLLYDSRPDEIAFILSGIHQRSAAMDTLDRKVVNYFHSNKNYAAILDYIITAKKAEKYFNPDYYSWDAVRYDSAVIEQLLMKFREGYTNAADPFLKNRYGFQVTRALSITGNYDDCLSFFDSAFRPTKEAGSMYFRSLGYKARSYYKNGEYGAANYIFSRLFADDPCSKYTALLSFHPQNEEDWNQTLALAKNAREKEVLWEMFGLYADPVKAAEKIYELNPASNSLPLLLVRTVNLCEEEQLVNPVRNMFNDAAFTLTKKPDEYGYPSYGYGYYDESRDAGSHFRIMRLAARAVDEKKVTHLAVWQLSYAYLELLSQNYKMASGILTHISIPKNDSLLLGQLAIIKGILAARQLTNMDASAEKTMYDHIIKIESFHQPELRKDNAIRHILSCLGLVYEKQKNTLKQELTFPLGESYYSTSESTQKMISFMNRHDLNSLEKYMASKYPLMLSDLHDVKATRFMYEYNFTAAMKEFELSKGESTELLGNPFNIRITDCHDCDHAMEQKVKYTKYSFCKKMTEIKNIADTSRSNEVKARNYFLYANGIYNLTWYGNARIAHETVLGLDQYYYFEDGDIDLRKEKNTGLFNCAMALSYYQKAFALTNDREFKAKCTWMSAKCEHNNWINEGNYSDEVNFVAGNYFKQMKSGFADTKYYKEVISECGYFDSYINMK